jgi:hypothetical protein
MIRLPAEMSVDDVSQWLSGGYFLVRKRNAAGVVEWLPSRWIAQERGVVVSETLAAPHTILRTRPTSCAAVWPEMGSFNAPGGYAVYMSRIVERQYRRTYHSRMVDIQVPWAYRVANRLGLHQGVLAAWTACGALPFCGTFPASYDEAEERIYNGAPTVAVNRRLIVAGDGQSTKRLLYMDGVLAATVLGGRLSYCGHPCVYDDLIRMTGGRFDVIS